MDEQRVREIVQSLAGLNFKQWQAIEQHVNTEFQRMANMNTFGRTENVVKNAMLELGNS